MTYDELKTALAGKLTLSDEQIAQLHLYAFLLKSWNAKFNMTSIDEEPEVIEKHFYDSLIPAKAFSFDGKSCCDLGTGAGFPGMVWAIAFPTAKLTLVDATGKKCTFLKEVVSQLKLTNVTILNKRAEELGLRESFDVVTARAVGALPILLEIGVPWVKVGGIFLAMKSAKGREELVAAKNAMGLLHVSLKDTQQDELPSQDGLRLNYFFLKKEKSEKRYPRPWAEIVKKPL